MAKVMNGQPKRIISVGLMKPSCLEGDTIYVQLKGLRGQLFAEAISNEPFRYLDCRMIKVKRATNTSAVAPNFYYEVDDFLEILKKYNNAERIDEFDEELIMPALEDLFYN